MHSYNQIYGDLSVGAGSWMDNKLFKKNLAYPFSKQVINSFKKVILKDLKRINIHNKIKIWMLWMLAVEDNLLLC